VLLSVWTCTDISSTSVVYCQYGSVLPNLAAVCASIYHTIHTLTLTPTLNPTLTPNLTLISSYLTNKHQCTQPNISANWLTSRLRNQSAARCKNVTVTDTHPNSVWPVAHSHTPWCLFLYYFCGNTILNKRHVSLGMGSIAIIGSI